MVTHSHTHPKQNGVTIFKVLIWHIEIGYLVFFSWYIIGEMIEICILNMTEKTKDKILNEKLSVSFNYKINQKHLAQWNTEVLYGNIELGK